MSAAAFSGDYTDLRFVKTRSVCQVVIELDISQASSFVAAFGAPMPGTGVPVAIAKLDLTKAAPEPPKAIAAPAIKYVRNGDGSVTLPDDGLTFKPYDDPPSKPPKERRSWSALSYAEQAGIRCQEPAFWQFLKEDGQAQENNVHVSSSDEAADAVRVLCTVKSRADIKIGTDAGDYWLALNNDYESWLRRPTF